MIEAFAEYSWMIVALPVASFFAIAAAMVCAGKSQRLARALSPWIIILALSGALVIAVGALLATLQGAGHGGAAHTFSRTIAWLVPEPMQGGIDRTLGIGILIDPLSAIMLVVVTAVSLLVQIYSCGYMKPEEHPRFYLYMSLFTASMLGLVIASTLVQLFICWELVGLCSYLLIGFWYKKPEAARAAIKAFVVTRFGDLGLLLAVFVLWLALGDLSFAHLAEYAGSVQMLLPLWGVALLIFFGACGKSAQFPLHFWLPDAMEGPTSVSALIHAATMVAAGIYLVARLFFLFQAAPESLVVVALVGAFTALFAASIALVQADMKKVMAYSTISQLGYMMMGLGLAAPAAAFFHLTTHAFFKALLFLTAGSVIHAAHTQNIWEMGGLFRKMKVTAITCLIGGLALAGIPPLAGFFSKDKLLEAAWGGVFGHGEGHALAHLPAEIGWPVLIMAMVTVLLTAFYTTRMWTLVFLGKPRSTSAERAHESPFSMQLPLIVLAGCTVLAGIVVVPQWTGLQWHEVNHFALSPAGLLGLALAVAGLLGGIVLYAVRVPAGEPLRRLGPLHTALAHLWYVDAFFSWVAGRVVLALGRLTARFDKGVIDGGLVDGTAWLTGRLGVTIRRLSAGPVPGQLQYYALLIFAIAALVVLGMTMRDSLALVKEALH